MATIKKRKMKPYFIVWIEGFEYKRGEKVSKLTDTGYEITTKMTEALRVKAKDIDAVRYYLQRHGVAHWCIFSQNTFVGTSYAPKGTILNLSRYKIS
jgi:hypothetical protein